MVFFYIYKKHGIDISSCIIGVYMLTSLCSIILSKVNVGYGEMKPSLFPTIIYCSMITLVTYPFYKFDSNKKREFHPLDIRVFKTLSYLYIIGTIFSAILFKDDIIFRITMGDEIGTLRGAKDLGGAQGSLTGPLRMISSFFVTIISMSAVSFILFFYSVSYLKMKWYFNLLLFLSTVGCIIQGIIGIDRSITFYWIIDFIFIFILMRPYLTDKTKKIYGILSSMLLFFAGSYIAMVTFSRFGDDTEDSLIRYMGQNYLNFCWYWDNYELPFINWGFFCPISSHIFGLDWGAPVSAVAYGDFVETKVGYFVGVFYTFMGTVMLYLGQWFVIPFCFMYYKIADSFINSNDRAFGVQTFIRILVLAIVPYNGVILYLYVDYIRLMAALVLMYFCYIMDRKANGVI